MVSRPGLKLSQGRELSSHRLTACRDNFTLIILLKGTPYPAEDDWVEAVDILDSYEED
jgi:hypothetical protein